MLASFCVTSGRGESDAKGRAHEHDAKVGVPLDLGRRTRTVSPALTWVREYAAA